MEIYYQGKNITDLVMTRKCIARDTCGEKCDSLEIEFENAGGWYAWGPKEDDQILIAHAGYNTGVMYVNTVLPENGRYRIFATSLPCKAREKMNRSYAGKTVEEIMRLCAMNSWMGFSIFGMDTNTVIPYVQQENEGCAAFLHRVLTWEGATLKCFSGKYMAIGLSWAQDCAAQRTISVEADRNGIQYNRSGRKLKEVIIETPYARSRAEDLDASNSQTRMTINAVPARNDIQAGRYARGILLSTNRKCEQIEIQSTFDPGFTAMCRMDITGGTDADGEWLIEEAEHDFIELKSKALMHRCIRSIQ